MGASLFVSSKYSTTNAAGLPLAGGQVFTYAAGSLTPQATYTNQSGSSPNTNPVVLDASGRASIWLGPYAYRFIVKDANGVLMPDGDTDNITSPTSTVSLTTPTTDLMTGDGTTTVYTLSANPATVNNVFFSLGGAIQVPGVDYTLSGLVITCTSPPPAGVAGFFNYTVALPVGQTDASMVTYNPNASYPAGSIGYGIKAHEVWLEDFLTPAQIADANSGAPTIDLSNFVQAAADSVCPVLPSVVAPGKLVTKLKAILLGTTLNLTNSRTSGTRWRDGFVFEGASMNGTKLVGQTGSGRAVIETTGSQWLTLRNFYIGSGTTNKSTVGIYQGLATILPQTQNQKFERIYINLHDDVAANSGAGTIALWNFGAEENTYDSCYFQANRWAYITAHSSDGAQTIAPYAFSYQTLAATHSCGVNTFTGETFGASLNKRFPGLLTEDVNSITFENLYQVNIGSGGTNKVAWEVRGALAGVQFSGTCEQHATLFDVYGLISSSNFRVTTGSVADTSAEFIKLRRGGQGAIVDSDFKISANADGNRPLFASNPLSSTEPVTCMLANSTFKTNLATSYLGVPENTLWNPTTMNVAISGASGYQYRIGNGWQEIDIPDTQVLPSATSRIAQVTLPTLNAGISAGGVTVKVTGNLRIQPVGSSAPSSRSVDGAFSFATSRDQVPTVATGTVLAATQADVSTAGNSITAAALSGSASGTAKVDVILLPTRTGTNAEAVNFRGTLRMYWGGWNGVAPSLSL